MNGTPFDSRAPDYTLSVLNKATGDQGKVGVGWIDSRGFIRIRLNPCVTLTHSSDLVITLFKRDADAPDPPHVQAVVREATEAE